MYLCTRCFRAEPFSWHILAQVPVLRVHRTFSTAYFRCSSLNQTALTKTAPLLFRVCYELPFWNSEGKTVTLRDVKKHTKRKLLRLGALFVFDGLFFSLINPVKAYAVVIIVGFVLLVITLYVLIDFVLAVSERIIPFSLYTKRRMALATTLVLSLLLALQSIGQLTTKDVLAVIPLAIVLSVYFSYMLKKRA